MHQRIIGENLIKIGLILSAQWRFSEERCQACPVTLRANLMALNKFKSKIITLLNRGQLKIQEQLQNRIFFISRHMPFNCLLITALAYILYLSHL